MNDKVPATRTRRRQKTDEEDILSAAAEILERRFQRQGRITDPLQAADVLKARVAHLDREVFGVVFLDTRHRVLAIEHLFEGTIDTCEVHPREVVRRSMGHNAAALILFHNHPSGEPEPSAADRALTRQLKQALALLDVRVLDHLVIGGRRHVSMAARGWV